MEVFSGLPKQTRQRVCSILVRQILEQGEDILLQNDPDTAVQMSYTINGNTFTTSGHAKRLPKDKWDAEEGREIARKRAARKIARDIYQYHRIWDLLDDLPPFAVGSYGTMLTDALLLEAVPQG